MELDPRLEGDSTFVMELPLSQVRLNHNAAFPWIVLIPRRKNLVEIIDLASEDRLQLMHEICSASDVMRETFRPDKLNVANLGNVVPQLHVHIIARFKTDAAWPGPVWNSGVVAQYDVGRKADVILRIKQALLTLSGESLSVD